MHVSLKIGVAIAMALPLFPAQGLAAVSGALNAGAARIDITPDANALPRPYTSIHDPLYARAIYLENGHGRALLLNADVGGIGNAITDKVSTEISRELDVPVANILISATHDHSAIFGGPRPSSSSGQARTNRPASRRQRGTGWCRTPPPNGGTRPGLESAAGR